jgi:two-component sensor histidine kinase
MVFMRRLTLRTRLALLVLASILPLVGFNLVSGYLAYIADRDRATNEALDLARSLAQAVAAELGSRMAVLEVLALSRRLADGDLAGFRAQAEAVLARQAPGANILLLTEDGQQLLNTILPPDAPLPKRRYLDNQRRVFATGQPAVSDLFVGVVQGRPLIAIDVPVRRPDGSVGMVLGLNPTLDAFEPLLRRQRAKAGWFLVVLDRTGRRVARVPDGASLVGQPVTDDLLGAWTTGAPEGVVRSASAEGIPVLTAYSRVPEIGWGVAVAVPQAELVRPAVRSALISLGVGLLLLALGLGLARLVARGITRPILSLLGLAAAAESKEIDGRASPDLGLPEADRLATALLGEARRRRAALAALLDSERRLRLVVAELNHRAKNALATVQALALQTARSEGGDPTRFTETFTARLKSLGRAHDLLARLAWEGAALGAILRSGLAPWLEVADDETPPRIAVCGSCDVPLPLIPPGQAQALMMALHELATNATKYGALSVPTGQVEIACRADPGGLALTIIWQERGGPAIAGPPARRGFGTRLLERALVHELGGGAQVHLEFAPAGLRATIHFSARPVRTPALT